MRNLPTAGRSQRARRAASLSRSLQEHAHCDDGWRNQNSVDCGGARGPSGETGQGRHQDAGLDEPPWYESDHGMADIAARIAPTQASRRWILTGRAVDP
jgi:hypothetical protein